MLTNILIGIVVLLIVGAIAIQYKSFKEWLIWGVTAAESYLGSGTGQLKLKYVYDLALARFPFLIKIMTFNLFSKLVDKALAKMKEMLETNEKIDEFVKKQSVKSKLS